MVRAGYKQTEVGVIPEDWEVKSGLEVFIKIQDGTHFSPKISNGNYLYLTSKNIKDGYLNLKDICFIDKKQHDLIYKRCNVKYGDILLTKDGANTGNVALNTIKDEFSLLSSIAFLRVSDNNHNKFYLQQILSEAFQKQVQDAMSGNAITRLTLTKIKLLKFYCPSLKEQTAIATALSDIDALITTLTELIDKKRQIKTATMQQLLTGKQRLAGFGEGKGMKSTELGEIPEDWGVKTYGQIFDFLKNYSYSRSDLLEDGEIGYIHYGDIHTKFHTHLNPKKSSYTYLKTKLVKNPTLVKNGDIVIADASEDYEGIGKSIEIINLTDQILIAGLHTLLLRDKTGTFATIFKGYLATIPSVRAQFERLATGLKVYGLSKNSLKQVYLPVPPFQEQQAIAQVLSDMDDDLNALEARLTKTKAIKQGMMQELLTGRTRLI